MITNQKGETKMKINFKIQLPKSKTKIKKEKEITI